MSESTLRMRPDYLVIGHVAKDMLPGGRGVTAGGTATYSALAAQKLGLQAAVITSVAHEDLSLLAPLHEAGVWVHNVPSPTTTTFSNAYDEAGHRKQVLSSQAHRLGLRHVSQEWRTADIVHLGPIAQELSPYLPEQLSPACILGVTPQGWLRSWDQQGRVTHSAVPVPAALTHLPQNAVVVLSIEDVDYNPEVLSLYVKLAQLTVVTQGVGPAHIYQAGNLTKIPALPADIMDLTGAGDVFATAFFIRYAETHDPSAAAHFAHAAAACAIEGHGTSTIADRETVGRRMLKRET